MKSVKHKNATAASEGPSIKAFYRSKEEALKEFGGREPPGTLLSETATNSSSVSNQDSPCEKAKSPPRGLKAMLERDETTRAEILWCLKTIKSHDSLHSAAYAVNLFPVMFPD